MNTRPQRNNVNFQHFTREIKLETTLSNRSSALFFRTQVSISTPRKTADDIKRTTMAVKRSINVPLTAVMVAILGKVANPQAAAQIWRNAADKYRRHTKNFETRRLFRQV
jgi:hypothetical protein